MSATNGVNGTHALAAPATLDVGRLFDGARIVVLGGTGFLGKVFWGMLLDRYPNLGKIFVMVRASKGRTSEERFWADVAPSEAFETIKAAHPGDAYAEFLKEKVVAIDGDMGRPFCGVDEALLKELRGTIDAVVNVAGLVDFNPPLDEAIDANAFGAQHLVELARALGDVPVMHTSTCYVAGKRVGPIAEVDPRELPFPRADELGRDLWDPDREIRECLDLIAQAKHRCEDAFRQSEFLETAEANLKKRGEPAYGPSLDAEVRKVKRKLLADILVEAGVDRATHWGWPNIYTYTKSIGEQIVARSGLPFAIARPACCETTTVFPFPGWNEGMSTSVPILFLILKGEMQIPALDVPLDFIPTDFVCSGMVMTLAELLEGSHKPVYQYGASDVNPCTARRLGELIALYKRKHYARKGTGNPFLNFLQGHLEPTFVTSERLDTFGSPAIARVGSQVAALMKKVAVGPAAPVLKPAAKSLEGFAAQQRKVGEILQVFAPFTTVQNGPFSCANTRAAFARLSAEDRAKLPWAPEAIDWAEWMHEVHIPGVEKRILPEMEKKLKREVKPLRAHGTLVSMVDEMATRHGHALALQRMEKDGLSRVTFQDVGARMNATAARLAGAGIGKGDRVVLGAHNHPDWAIAYFGILRAGATAVPIDPALDATGISNVVRESRARVAVWDAQVEARVGATLREAHPLLRVVDLAEVTAEDTTLTPPVVEVAADDVASLIFTSGTTGTPKGVMLSHANFTSLVAALAPIFPLGQGDRVMSVLPLHHTFEFTCGLLLPFTRGARVVYLDELTGDRLAEGLKQARATAMVGVPALWQTLERRILSQVEAKGAFAESVFKFAGEMNRTLAKTTGLDAGKLLFGQVHEALGGNVKWLISGGAALPKDTYETFARVGLRLSEGYGLTEAAPVLTVSKPSSSGAAGNVGTPIPGVDVRIDAPDANGVGEVVARGPNVMVGYGSEASTGEVIDAQGWLHTGDLGRFDRKGRLEIVGRMKDIILGANGENIHPDDLERRIGKVEHIEELAIVGVVAPGGGERVACLAVPAVDGEVDRSVRLDRAAKALRDAVQALPVSMRPGTIKLYDAPLPRTATRKVKRAEVRDILTRMLAATTLSPESAGETTPVRVAIAAVRGRPVREIAPSMTLLGDLGFDSLSLSELLASLEHKYGAIDPQRLAALQTVAEVEALVAETGAVGNAKAESRTKTIEKGDDDAPIVIPREVQELGKSLIGRVQDAFYGSMMSTRVTGRAFIPHNRSTLVVANHASHLDMGLVRHALGTYGKDIVSLAAQDYFFDADPIRRAFFENFSNLRAIDRKAGLRQAERQAAEVIEQGTTMLVFPEGTRSTDGSILEFKPIVGQLALNQSVDILPIFLGGTHAAMPKGARIPTKREISARIGPPLCIADLRRLTEGMNRADAAREVARLAREAVLALKDGGVLDLSKVEKGAPVVSERAHPLVELFSELEGKFKPGSAKKPISFYFTLGGDNMAKWTVKVDDARCVIKLGKPDGGAADCVLKTSPEIFSKIVREAYTPSPAEFMSGAIKSNDLELLQTFQKVFQLA
jgi:long-chain acyl-CoA synthetase